MPLSLQQRKAVELLLVEPSVTAVAQKIDVDPSTIYRWLRDNEEFKDEVKWSQRYALKQNVRYLASMAEVAVDGIKKLILTATDERLRLDAAHEALERLFDADLVMRADEDSEPPPVSGDSGNTTPSNS